VAAGVAAYLRKPLDEKTLLAAIDNAIDASNLSDSDRGHP
jgi:AmiR/NasT family two-component response regulator